MTLQESDLVGGTFPGTWFFKRIRRSIVTLIACASLTACVSVTSTPPVLVDANRTWALLPFTNLSTTPQADGQLAELVETALRSRGIHDINIYRPNQPVTLRSLVDESTQIHVANQWARDAGQEYALSGSVHEWQYRAGAEREPTVGFTLKLTDVKSGKVLWQGNAARTGLGFTNLPTLANKLVHGLLSQLTVSGPGS